MLSILGDITSLRGGAQSFRRKLSAARRTHPSIVWYPYDTLANLAHLDRLLTGRHRRILELAGGEPIVDIGCADGDLAFFLESCGCTVHVVDYPATNHNAMTGLYALHASLHSSVRIHEADIDSSWTFPVDKCGLALLLGALYHLKNPFAVLETISRHARYCLFSTRVARRLPSGESMENKPIAYLVDDQELNKDNSNFWIFSETALRRLLRRANWKVLDWVTLGDTRSSNPVDSEHDERAFFLAQSTFGLANVDLLYGWHECEGGSWRWTERCFSIRAHWPDPVRKPVLHVAIYVPPELIERIGPVTLSASANGMGLPPQTFSSAGDFNYRRGLPAEEDLQLDFTLDRCLIRAEDERELGLIVASISLD